MLPRKITCLLMVAILVLFATSAFAQSDSGGLGGTIQELGETAAQGYLGPFVTVFGTGMNAGWYNSSKSYSFLKMPFGLSIGAINIPIVAISDDMRTFDFTGDLPLRGILQPVLPVSIDAMNAEVDSLANSSAITYTAARTAVEIILSDTLYPDSLGIENTVTFTAAGQPTVFGPDSTADVAMDALLAGTNSLYTLRVYNAMVAAGLPGTTVPLTQDLPMPFVGLDAPAVLPSVPSGTYHIGISKIPVVDNLMLGIRYMPAIELGDFGKIGQFGFKLQHEITPHLPFAETIPFLHLSAYWAMNRLKIETGPATLTQGNWVAMLNASADAKFLLGAGAFIGLGIESSSLDLEVDMSDLDLPDLSLSIPGDNGFRFQTGVRFSLLCFDLWADANFGAVTSYNIGITALGLNGL